MATITVTLVKDCWIAGVKQTAGSSVTIERSLAGELITNGIAAKPSNWDSSVSGGSEVFAEVNSTGGIASLTVSGTKVVDFEFGDNLTSPSDTTTLTAAMSNTVALSATATGTYRKARVSWINNGASASAKLYISVNADNDVQGLVASQSSRRRDHEMTMGDAIILVCDVPITRLTFSSDVSITSNTHRLIVTFGE